MNNERIKIAMTDNNISNKSEVNNAIDFVSDLLRLAIEETEENWPNATASIEEMKIALNRISLLSDLIE